MNRKEDKQSDLIDLFKESFFLALTRPKGKFSINKMLKLASLHRELSKIRRYGDLNVPARFTARGGGPNRKVGILYDARLVNGSAKRKGNLHEVLESE